MLSFFLHPEDVPKTAIGIDASLCQTFKHIKWKSIMERETHAMELTEEKTRNPREMSMEMMRMERADSLCSDDPTMESKPALDILLLGR